MTRVTQLIHDAGKYLLISVYPLHTHPTHNFTHKNGGNLETLPGWPKKLQHNRPARSAGQQVQTLAYLAVAWQVVIGCYVWNIYANGSVDEHFFGKLWTYNDDSRPVSENMMEALGVFLNSSSPNCSILNQNCAYYHIFSVLLKVTQ